MILMKQDQLPLLKAKYSIFLPVRNGEAYLAKAIESVLSQKVKDFILIILENKSTDQTLSIIQGFDDPRIVMLEAQSDLGICENWNRIYELISSGQVQTEFSTLFSDDDIYYPDFLATIDQLQSTDPGASAYQTHFDLIDKFGNIIRPCKSIPACESHKDFFLSCCWGNRDIFGTGTVFRTKDYVKVGGMSAFPLLLWSDDLLVIRLTKLSYKICGGRTAFAYRSYKKSLSGAISVDKFEAVITALNLYLTEIKNHHADLIETNNDKIALGFLIARVMDWYDFPLRRVLMREEIAKTVGHLRAEAAQLMQGHTLHELSKSNFVGRLYSRLRQYYVMFLFCSRKCSQN